MTDKTGPEVELTVVNDILSMTDCERETVNDRLPKANALISFLALLFLVIH